MRRKPAKSLVPVEIQTFESRVLLSATHLAPIAAGVQASVTAEGYLVVKVKGNNNSVAIQTNSQGMLEIVGLNGTTVNGGTGPFIATGVTSNFRVIYDGANNTVSIGSSTAAKTVLSKNVFVDMGLGPNTLNLTNLQIARSLAVERGTADVVNSDSTVQVGGTTDLNKPLE